jgi:hypothetical protein
MKFEDIKTKQQFINYMKPYVIVCIYDYYDLRRLNDYTYEISFHKEKHRPNWYNDSEIKDKRIQCTADKCFDLIRNEIRRQKLKKLKSRIV